MELSEEEKEAKLELNRFIYGKQLSKDDIADYLGILFNLIEKQQKEIEEKNIAVNKMSKDISRQLEEIEEKTTIIMAGAEKVKRLECQIEELLNVLNKEEKINYIKPIDIKVHNYISEDKIREKLNQIDNEYSILLSNKSLSLERQNMNAQRHEAMQVVLEELLEENNEKSNTL